MLFSDKHIWIKESDGVARIGITTFAQEKLGNIMFVNFPEAGDKIVANERFGDIESVKTVSDLISPLSGDVVAVNEEILDEPYLINDDAMESWFIEVSNYKLLDNLMDENTYNNRKEEL